MIEALLDPFAFGFFRNGLLVATLSGALCGLVGTYVVLRGMSYIGHGLSHAIFGGFAAATLLGTNVFLGAGAWGIGSALAIQRVSRRRIIGADAAIGVVTTASFALGLAMFAIFGRRGRGFDAALFGSVLGVEVADVLAVAGVGVLAVALIWTQYRRLLFATFDPEVARVQGIDVGKVDAALMAVLALTILVTMQVLGVTLIAATLVVPAATARLLTNAFGRMLRLATGIGAVTGFVGMIASYHLDVQSGPAIVLVGAAIFAVVFLLAERSDRAAIAHIH